MRHTLLIATTSFTLIAGCAGNSAFQRASTYRVEAQAPGESPSDASFSSALPSDLPSVMEVPGTSLDLAEVEDGVSLTFSTIARDRVDELRLAARGLSQVYAGTLEASRYGRSERDALKSPAEMGMPSSMASVELIRGGARVLVRATDPSDAPRLRNALLAQGRAMQRGRTPFVR